MHIIDVGKAQFVQDFFGALLLLGIDVVGDDFAGQFGQQGGCIA